MGLRTKPSYNYLNQGPGPGTYSMKHLEGKKRYSFRKRTKIDKDWKVPGPGTYESSSSIRPMTARSFTRQTQRPNNEN